MANPFSSLGRRLGREFARAWTAAPADPSVFFMVGVGLMGAAASFLLIGQIASPKNPEATIWFDVAFGVLLVGFGSIVLGAVEGFRQAQEASRAPLLVEHDPDDPQCRQVRQREGEWELRIRVRNVGRFGLNPIPLT
jgi:hypothetical protein